jgi:ATP-dependent DNA helicase RecG
MIIDFMLNNSAITAKELAINLDISVRKTEENIKKLRELGIIQRIGPAKGGYWKINEPLQ